MAKKITKEQAKKATAVVVAYSKQEAKAKAQHGAKVAGKAAKAGAKKIGNFMKKLF